MDVIQVHIHDFDRVFSHVSKKTALFDLPYKVRRNQFLRMRSQLKVIDFSRTTEKFITF